MCIFQWTLFAPNKQTFCIRFIIERAVEDGLNRKRQYNKIRLRVFAITFLLLVESSSTTAQATQHDFSQEHCSFLNLASI